MLGAIASFTSMAIAGRAINFALDTFEIMLFRSVVGCIIIGLVIVLTRRYAEIKFDRFRLHFIRNAVHFIGQNLWFLALPLVPLAQLFAFEFTTPIWVILLSPLLLSERLTKVQLLSACLGFLGILLVAQPGSSPITIGIIAAAGCAIFFALTAIFTRKLTRDQSILCILFFLTTMQAVFGLICAGYDGDISPPDSQTLPWVVLIGFAGLMAHFCLTNALLLAPASIVMPVDFGRLPIIAVIGMLFYDEPFSILIILGAILIFAANYINITAEGRKSPEIG